jgi:hypothetical protein
MMCSTVNDLDFVLAIAGGDGESVTNQTGVAGRAAGEIMRSNNGTKT